MQTIFFKSMAILISDEIVSEAKKVTKDNQEYYITTKGSHH